MTATIATATTTATAHTRIAQTMTAAHSTPANNSPIEAQVQALVEPLLRDFGVELFDIVWGGGRLRVTVDTPEGIDTTLLTKVSRTISQELDIHDPIPGKYHLEVSSPGLERRLRRPEHYAKSLGFAVTLKLTDGQTRLQGTIVEANDTEVVLELGADGAASNAAGGSKSAAGSSGNAADAPADATRQSVPYASIARAQTVFTWPSPVQSSQNKSSQNKSSKNKPNQSNPNQHSPKAQAAQERGSS